MIYIDMDMPNNCTECKLFKGCDDPSKFPFVECHMIGNLGSMFNQTSRPIDCPLHELNSD